MSDEDWAAVNSALDNANYELQQQNSAYDNGYVNPNYGISYSQVSPPCAGNYRRDNHHNHSNSTNRWGELKYRGNKAYQYDKYNEEWVRQPVHDVGVNR